MSQKNRHKAVKKARRLQPITAWHAGLRRTGIALLGFGGLLITAGMTNQALSIREWQIEGTDPFLRQAIERELGAMQSLDFLHAQPARLRSRLMAALPDLAGVKIIRHLPDRLHIIATARLPVALWQQGEQLKLIDSHGQAYVSQRADTVWDLPILRSGQQQLPAAGRLLAGLQGMDGRWYAKLSECTFLEPNAWALHFNHGQRWILPAGNVARQRLRSLLPMLRQDQWKNHAWQIDTRMHARWFFRRANRQVGAI